MLLNIPEHLFLVKENLKEKVLRLTGPFLEGAAALDGG